MKLTRIAVRALQSETLARWFKVTCAIWGISIIAFAGWTYFGFWELSRPPFSQRTLSRLNPNMDTNAAVRLLGTPRQVETYTNGEQASLEWTYWRPSGWKFLTLSFGADGHFERYITD